MVMAAQREASAVEMGMEVLFTQYLERHRNIEGCIKISDATTQWMIFFRFGKIVYATNSLQPFERLDRHLKRLSHQVPSLNRELRSMLSDRFSHSDTEIPPDLQAITWLIQEKYLPESLVTRLVARLCEEVIATQLWVLERYESQVVPLRNVPMVCSFEPGLLFQGLRKRLRAWQALAPLISSPYQRPYLGFDHKSEISKKLSTILRGFNFRQLSAIHNEDEILIARRLHPLIAKGTVILRPPQSPFHVLPLTAPLTDEALCTEVEIAPPGVTEIADYASTPKTWKVVCVDDSEAMLLELKRLLSDETLEISTINDPKKAMMKINSVKPDLILMDVGMPHIDGYQLCALLRKSSTLKDIPIVMVTGNKGIIDRARARLVGATDYLTKPFSAEDLNAMVFRYLS